MSGSSAKNYLQNGDIGVVDGDGAGVGNTILAKIRTVGILVA